MKTNFVTILFITLLSSAAIAEAPRRFGAGVLLGSPTALSGKYFMKKSTAIDGGISFSSHELLMFGDYLKHFNGAFGKQNEFVAALSPYAGVGPLIAFNTNHHHHKKNGNGDYFDDDHHDDDFAFGGRIPLGVEWMAPQIRLGVSLEIVPGIVIIPETDAFIQAGLAVRYYF